jgi:hypothetical protein
MDALAELRRHVDELNDRVVLLEQGHVLARGDVSTALVVARAAERATRTTHEDVRTAVGEACERMDQLTELLRAAFPPALRPENTQSDSDKPLT